MSHGNLARILIEYPTLAVPTEGTKNSLRKRNTILSLLFDGILVLLITVPIAFWNLGDYSLGVPDEIFEAGAAIEMGQTGNWLLPTVNGRTFFDKPPLKLWMTAGVAKLLGTSNFSYRLIDALAGVGTMLLTYYLGRLLFASRLIGLFAVFSFLGCQIFVIEHGIRTAVQDSLLVFLSTLVMVCAWQMCIISRAITHPRAKPQLRKLGPLAGVAIGCALLTKSAAALMPIIVFGTFLILSGQLWPFVKATWKQLFIGLALAVVVGGSYFIGHCYFTPGACNSLIGHHVISRVTTGIHDVSGLEFFLIRIFQHRASFPPELLILSLLTGVYCWLFGRDHRYGLLFVWSVLPVVLYSFASTKFSWYIAPAFPAMAILIAATVVSCGRLAVNRLGSWWAGKTQLRIRTLMFTMICLYGIGTAVVAYASNLNRISGMTSRIPADLAVADVLNSRATLGRKPQILSYRAPTATVHEWAYFQMLNPLVTVIENEPLFTERLQGEPPDFLLTDLHSIKQLPKKWQIKNYTYLPPLYSRANWLTVVSFIESDAFEYLTSWKNVIDFGTADFPSMYGFSGPEKFGNLGVRWMSGQSAEMRVPGDGALHLLGAKIFLNISPQIADTDNTAAVEVFINGERTTRITAISNTLDTYGFVVPPRTFRSGENSIRFVVSAGDQQISRAERSVMFNWISVRLNQQDIKAPS